MSEHNYDKMIAYLDGLSREELANKLQRNDPNGVWSDENSKANDMEPIKRGFAYFKLVQTIMENEMTYQQLLLL